MIVIRDHWIFLSQVHRALSTHSAVDLKHSNFPASPASTREIVDFAHRAPETPPTIPKLVSDSEIYYFRMRKQVPRAYRRVRIYDFQQALPVTMTTASVGDFGRLLSL